MKKYERKRDGELGKREGGRGENEWKRSGG